MSTDEAQLPRQNQKMLTQISSGTICKLVGVSEVGWKFKHESSKRGKWGWGRHHHHSPRSNPFREQWKMKRRAGIMRRLLDLGLTKGCTFVVVQGSRGGPILVEVRGTRIALGNGLASRLIVEEVGSIQ